MLGPSPPIPAPNPPAPRANSYGIAGPRVHPKGLEKKRPCIIVVSSPQRGEDTAFLSGFPLGGIHDQAVSPINMIY